MNYDDDDDMMMMMIRWSGSLMKPSLAAVRQ